MNKKFNTNGVGGGCGSRDDLLDAVKGIAVYFVVAGHLLAENETALSVFITVCHMPTFFFVSGYFFKNSSRCAIHVFIRKKAAALLIPYICWSLVSLFVNGAPLLLYKNLAGFRNQFMEVLLYARSVWFLVILFLTEIFYFLVIKAAERLSCSPYTLGILMWAAFLWVFSGREEIMKVFQMYKFEWLFPYFLAGNICCGILGTLEKRHVKLLETLLSACIYILFLLIFYNEDAYIEFYGGFHLIPGHTAYYFVYYVLGFMGITLVFFAAGSLKAYSATAIGIFSMLGYYSIDIYVLHMFFVKLRYIFFDFVEHDFLYNYVVVPFYSFIVVISVALFSKYVLRHFWIYRFGIGRD